MLYELVGKEWEGIDVVMVDLRITPKSYIITPISKRPYMTNGCIDQLWDNGKIIVREPTTPHKICKHYLESYGDDKYIIYPDRAGIPYLLNPKQSSILS